MQIDWNDPIGSIEAKQYEIKKEHGLWADRVTLSRAAFERLSCHPKVLERLAYLITPELLAPIFGPPYVDFLIMVDDRSLLDARFTIAGGQLPKP